MPRLNARLSKLEQRHGASDQGNSFIIQRRIVWREEGVLRSRPAYASVLDGTGCERVAYSEGENEEAFDARVDAKASGSD